MTLASLSAETPTFYNRRYSSRSPRPAAANAAVSTFETLAAPATAPDFDPPPPPPPLHGSPYERLFKADLTSLHPQDAEPSDFAVHAGQEDFLGHLGALISGVQAGDVIGAQAAADALQADLSASGGPLTTAALDAPGRMLDDLRALIVAARQGDVRGAHQAAHRLSVDIQTALTGALPDAAERAAPAPDSISAIAEGASAAYDTLLELAEASVSHAA